MCSFVRFRKRREPTERILPRDIGDHELIAGRGSGGPVPIPL